MASPEKSFRGQLWTTDTPPAFTPYPIGIRTKVPRKGVIPVEPTTSVPKEDSSSSKSTRRLIRVDFSKLEDMLLSTNYGLGIGKVGYRGIETTFAWKECENTLGKPPIPVNPTEIRTSDLPVLGSLAQHEISALDNHATEAGLIVNLFLLRS
uniref:Uncharacterized protein n=1 Tax=Timema bartmani TaxID=61472 RepID=A0A7R9ESE9_9NEOP|nr:unnamed protein product [Timema bartmani]